jgi:hypothetical protein
MPITTPTWLSAFPGLVPADDLGIANAVAPRTADAGLVEAVVDGPDRAAHLGSDLRPCQALLVQGDDPRAVEPPLHDA